MYTKKTYILRNMKEKYIHKRDMVQLIEIYLTFFDL